MGLSVGLFFAVSHAHVFTSTDQVSYTEAVSGRVFNDADYAQLVWDGAQVFAVGEFGRRTPVVASVDGINWIVRSNPSTPPPNNAVSGVGALAYSSALGRYVSSQATQADGIQLL